MASDDWLEGFMKRHLALSLRKPERCHARYKNFTKENVKIFFDKIYIKEVFQKILFSQMALVFIISMK